VNTTPPRRQAAFNAAAVDALVLDTTPWLSCEDCFERMDSYVEALRRDPGYVDQAMSTPCGVAQHATKKRDRSSRSSPKAATDPASRSHGVD
jgi:hypothetical protein